VYRAAGVVVVLYVYIQQMFSLNNASWAISYAVESFFFLCKFQGSTSLLPSGTTGFFEILPNL